MKAKIMLLMLSAFLLSAAVGQAQHGELYRLQSALEKTDELIARAKEAVRESGSERAQNQLDMAVRLQKMAREMVVDNTFDNVIETTNRAGNYTISAREKAQLAIAITRQAEENEDYVRRRLEKTDQLFQRIEERAGEETPAGIQLMLNSAREKQLRAMELFRNRRLKAALELTLQIEKSLQQAIDRAGGQHKAQKRYQAQLDRYFALRERIELAGGGDRAQIAKQLENAEEFRVQAGNFSLENRHGRAEKTMMKAVEILSRVAENLREPEKIKAAIAEMIKQAEQLRNRVQDHGDQQDREQFQTAERHLEKAGTLHSNGDYEAAAAQLQAARQLLSRIAEQEGKAGPN